MAADLAPRIIVLALGAGVLGFPDALPLLLQVAGRSPLRDIFICVFAMAVVTAQVLGTMLLVRFVRKEARAAAAAGARGGALAAPPADRFAKMTLVVSLGVAFLVFACLVVASGAGAAGLGMLYLVADIARERPVIAVLVTGAAAVLPCTRPLLRVVFRVREEDHSHDGAAAAASTPSTGTGRFANVNQVTNFTGAAAAFLLAVSGGLYIQRFALIGVAAVVVAVLLLARFTRTPRNAAADAGGDRAAPTSAADTRRFGKLTPYLAIVSCALICLVLTSYPCSA